MTKQSHSKRKSPVSGRSYQPASDIDAALHRPRAERGAAVANVRAAGNWLKISEIVDDVAKAKGAQFNGKKRNRIATEVCESIVLDSAAGRLGSEQSPVLMLLSEEYDELTLKPSWLAQTIKTAYEGMSSNKKRQAIAELLEGHCWMNRAVAGQWLKAKGFELASANEALDAALVTSRSALQKLLKPLPKPGPRLAARKALDALFPNGVPIDKSGKELTNLVNNWLRRQGSDLIEGRVRQEVGKDTVERAAERK
jgi:hypothetical protein